MAFVEFKGIEKTFGGNRVFRGLGLQVEKGEVLTILGGSGSGKTVLLKIFLGLVRPDRGTVAFEGSEVGRMNEAELRAFRRQVGMLFQGGALFDSLSVGENVAYPLREHFHPMSQDKLSRVVGEKLKLVGLPGIEAMMPSELSGGMKKRVALARAIATDPQVILYDEPTTGLDPANTQRINRLIVELNQRLGVTSLVVTHDLDSAFEISDRLALLADGKIAFVGTGDEIRASSHPVVRSFLHGQIGESGKVGGIDGAA